MVLLPWHEKAFRKTYCQNIRTRVLTGFAMAQDVWKGEMEFKGKAELKERVELKGKVELTEKVKWKEKMG